MVWPFRTLPPVRKLRIRFYESALFPAVTIWVPSPRKVWMALPECLLAWVYHLSLVLVSIELGSSCVPRFAREAFEPNHEESRRFFFSVDVRLPACLPACLPASVCPNKERLGCRRKPSERDHKNVQISYLKFPFTSEENWQRTGMETFLLSCLSSS